MAANLEKLVLETVTAHALIPTGTPTVVAVSGGPDSTCLLHLIRKLCPNAEVHGVYVDHNLRPDETTAERELVESTCHSIGAPFHARFVDVPAAVAESGESIEACARRLRYRELDDVRRAVRSDTIAVGHTADDQAEEILIRLIRGSGLKGLSGMNHRNGAIVRPLLDVNKAAILDYLNAKHIPSCHDSSNDSEQFLRNRVRMELLPLLEQRFNPSVRKTLIRTGSILKEEDDYLNAETVRVFDTLVLSESVPDPSGGVPLSLSCEGLRALHPALRRRVIETALWKKDARPQTSAIERIIELGLGGSNGAELHLPMRVRVVKQDGRLVITRLSAERGSRERMVQDIPVRLEIRGPGSYDCKPLGKRLIIGDVSEQNLHPSSVLIDGNRLEFPLTLRPAEAGERFYPAGGRGSRKVTRYLNDRKIPKHERHRYPVLVSENEVVCIVGLAVNEPYSDIKTSTDPVQVQWLDLL